MPVTTATRPARSPLPEVAQIVTQAAHDHLTAQLGEDRVRQCRIDVAGNRYLSPALAARLAKSRDATVRSEVAKNAATPAQLLAKLATDPIERVTDAARTNPHCPWGTVAAHATLGQQLCHPGCPAETLVAALDQRGHHKKAALAHPNLPPAVIDEWVKHGDAARDLLDNPALTHAQAQLILERGPDYLPWIWSKSDNADPDWLAELADACFDSHDQGTIARIAENRNTPGHVLTRIVAAHAHRDYALSNPSCPAEAFQIEIDRIERAGDDAGYSLWTRYTMLRNPACPRDVLDRLPVRAMLAGMETLLDFTLTHAESATQARTMLALGPTWTGTVGQLLTTAAAVAAGP